MIKIISKEGWQILLTPCQAKLSKLLDDIFFNEMFDKDEEQEMRIDKFSYEILSKIKFLMKIIIDNKITLEILEKRTNQYYEMLKRVKITPLFSLKDFFKLLDAVNFLNIDIIIYIMLSYIKNEITELTINEFCEKYNLTSDDIINNGNTHINYFNQIMTN